MANQGKEVLAAYKEGDFLQVVYDKLLSASGESSDLAAELVRLHNDGDIDVIAGFRSLQNQPSSGFDFFLTRHIFEKALPHLAAPIEPVMDCVLHLVNEAGQDMAAGRLFAPFIDFCAAEPSRPKESLERIETSIDQLVDLLVPTIVAGARIDAELYLNEAIRLTGHENIEIRRRAIFSLGRIRIAQGSNLCELALTCIELSLSRETDDQLLGNLIGTAFSLYQCKESQLERIIDSIKLALSPGGDYGLHAASELFGFHFDELPEPLLDVLLDHLRRAKPQNKGTIDNIDYGLVKLLDREHPTKGIQFLESLLLANPNELSLDAFDSATRKLIDNPHDQLNRLLTRWFLRGDRVLCEGIHAIVNHAHDHSLLLSVDPSELDSSDPLRIIFLARKAIGYLFFMPVTAASIIISLIQQTTEHETIQKLSDLLFDPLLINYPGKVNEYLIEQKVRESEKVRSAAEAVLKASEDYFDMLKSTGVIQELHPSQAQRDVYRGHFSRLMSESMKEAEKESVFFSLISKSVLLYGRTSIGYVDGPDGESNRMEIPLSSHGTEMEFARREIIDHVGLDYMLRIFRAEQINA